MTEETTTGTEAVAVSPANTISDEQMQEFQANLLARVEAIREQQTAMRLQVPAAPDDKPHLQRRVELQVRELAEVITTGNEGVVPDVLSTEIIGPHQPPGARS